MSSLCWNVTNLTRSKEASLDLDYPQNGSCLGHAPQLTYNAYIKVLILGTMSVLSFVANLWTIWSIAGTKRRKTSCSAIYTLILHLSIADILVTIFCMAGEALWSYYVAWLWGNAACKAFKFLQMFTLYLSTFVLVLIGIDRFVAVRYPMKNFNNPQKCNQLVFIAWLVAFILSVPQIIIFHVAQGPFIEEFSQCVTHGFYTEPWQEQLYTTMSLILMFILPLIILISTYVSTVITIAHSDRIFKLELANSNSADVKRDLNRRKLMHRARTKSLRISVVIVMTFVLWWTPYYVMMIIFMFLNPNKHLSADMQRGIFFFGMSNSLVNPLIYGAFHLCPQKRNRHVRRYRKDLSLHLQSTSFVCDSRNNSARFERQLYAEHSSFIIDKKNIPSSEMLLLHLIEDK